MKKNKNYYIQLTGRRVKKFRILILLTFLNVVKHLCQKLLNHKNVIEMYNQKIFFEHILIDETYCKIDMIVTRLKICKQFLRINKFFIIDIFFE